MANKSDFLRVKEGSYLSETQYYKVSRITGLSAEVVNERGFPLTISGGIIAEGMYTADQYSEVKDVTRTELIGIFNSVGDTIFTVNYHKQPSADSINDAIESANRGKILPIKEMKKLIKDAYKGEERTLVGYLIKNETGFGRSMVIDLEADTSKSTKDWDSRIRQVDHRTLNWLIWKNVKYQVKK